MENEQARQDTEEHKTAHGFSFSAVNLTQLDSSKYTLFGLAVDRSGSLAGFDQELETCVKQVIQSCYDSPNADSLMARVLAFSTVIEQIHGFQPLSICHPGLYTGKTRTGGSTCLYDATVDLVGSVQKFGKELLARDYQVNGIVVILTDGIDECSKLGVNQVKEAFAEALKAESLESLVTILIGVNVTNAHVSQYLENYKTAAGFSQYVEQADATPKTLAKIAGFISKSVSSQSQAVGSKQASQPITF